MSIIQETNNYDDASKFIFKPKLDTHNDEFFLDQMDNAIKSLLKNENNKDLKEKYDKIWIFTRNSLMEINNSETQKITDERVKRKLVEIEKQINDCDSLIKKYDAQEKKGGDTIISLGQTFFAANKKQFLVNFKDYLRKHYVKS